MIFGGKIMTDIVDQHLREVMKLRRFRVAYLLQWQGVEYREEITVYAQTALDAERRVLNVIPDSSNAHVVEST